MKVSEIRMSLLEADDSGKHTKHVSVTVTSPALCAAIADLIGKAVDLDKAPDAHQVTIAAPQKSSAA
jgi:hypothetical protein